jgi:2-polyprenyl-6-hydroxyphenyl methylase/3-demethylubiquinone-9 3-methyltransferase
VNPGQATAGRERELFYERFADQFDARMNRYEVSKRLRLVFEEALRDEDLAGRELLDAGCGTGLFSQVAEERGAIVTSVDVGESLLAEVAKKSHSRRIVGSVMDLPFPDRSFDVVICTEVIEHTVDPRRGVTEVARVLRPGGTLVLTTPNHRWHFAIRLANALKLRPYGGLENWVRWKELRLWLEQSGLYVARYRGFNALPFVHPVMYPLVDRLDRFGGGRLGRSMINILAVAHKLPVDSGHALGGE